MRRKVRGTVSGIYMYSAALGECVLKTPSRLHGARGLETKRVSRFLQACAIRLNRRSITPLAHYASACALRALCLSPETI